MKQSILHTDGDPHKKELRKKRHFSFRINLFFFLTFLLFSVLIVRLAILQFVEGKEMMAEKYKALYKPTKIAPIRGNIYDKDSFPIAYTQSVETLFFRVEAGQSDESKQVIEMAHKLEAVFKERGKPGSSTPTAEEIVNMMDFGFDINNNERKMIGYSWEPRRLKSDLSQKEIAYIMEHRDEFRWLEVSEESIRKYATEEEDNSSIATQLVGYMRPFSMGREEKSGLTKYKNPEFTEAEKYLDQEFVGYDGLELMYQDELRGKTGFKEYPVNAADRIIGKPTITKPEKGHNLYLTMKKEVQTAAEKAIKDHTAFMRSSKSTGYFHNPNAYTGYAVAMEVDTGKIMAMASMPDYDTNVWIPGISGADYSKIQPIINNGTIRTSFPQLPEDQRVKRLNSLVYVGSVIKPASVLLGLNEGFFTTSDRYNDTGTYTWGIKGKEASIRNSDGVSHGLINAKQAIQFSSNTFMSAMIGQKLYNRDQKKGADVLDAYFNKFGLGITTGTGLPYESAGLNDYRTLMKSDEGSNSILVRASWGQNEKYTTMQLAQYAATLASQGKRMKPQFVDKITTYEGEIVSEFKPEVLSEVNYPKEYWNTVVAGMKEVRKQGFDDFKYTIAAKTGTSTQQLPNGDTVDNAVFIAFVPAEKPKLAVAVVVPEGGFGAFGAAPIARKIFDAYDQYFGLDGVPKGPATPAMADTAANGAAAGAANTTQQSAAAPSPSVKPSPSPKSSASPKPSPSPSQSASTAPSPSQSASAAPSPNGAAQNPPQSTSPSASPSTKPKGDAAQGAPPN